MSWFSFWQPREGEAVWQLALADAKAEIIREHQCPMMTVLDLDTAIEGEMAGDDYAAIKYRGPIYFDFDSLSIDAVIPRFQEFLGKLEKMGVNLHQLQLFATGGKGFHVIIPPQVFIEKPSPSGYAHLPHIYHEIAHELYVDTLDLRVYTARKGRMFRVANVKRQNGRYKVPITVAEARSITPVSYVELTSAPRVLPDPPAPTYCANLALEFVKAKERVGKAMERRRKNKGDEKLITKFKGEFPVSLAKVMTGEEVNGSIGFQKLALQLSIIAHKLGKSEAQLIESAEGLIEKHESDGNRYNTATKRRAELRRMYQYMHDNPCYEFTVGGLKSMLPPGTPTPELEDGFGESPATVDAQGNAVEEEQDFGITLGMVVSRAGIFAKRDDGMTKVCAVGWDNPRELVNMEKHISYGFEVDVYRDGKPMGEHRIETSWFQSRSLFLKFIHSFGCNINATDAQIGGLLEFTRTRSGRSRTPTHAVRREGIDVIPLPDKKTRDDVVIGYVSQDGVILGPNEMRAEGINFALHGLRDPKGDYKTDIHLSKNLEGNEEERAYIEKLFTLNKKITVAKIYGFLLAAWLNQPIRHISGNFPLLQAYGVAGSGKSSLCELMILLHYHLTAPRRVACTNMTKFFCEASVAGSASIPFLMDEYKPAEMPRYNVDTVNNLLRGNWDCLMVGKGTVDRDNSGGSLGTIMMPNAAPILFVTESLVAQTAIGERSIVCPMRPEDRAHLPASDFDFCFEKRHIISRWGKDCMDAALGLSMPDLKELLKKAKSEITAVVSSYMELQGVSVTPNRQIHAYTCVLTGLEFGRLVLAQKFGTHFDETFASLKGEILCDMTSLVGSNRSEPTKAIDILAYLSESDNPDIQLRHGQDYMMVEGKDKRLCVDIRIDHAFDRYKLYCKQYGHAPLYDKFESYTAALYNHPACSAKRARSPLAARPSEPVGRFDLEILYKEKIREFKHIDNPRDQKATPTSH